MNHVKSYRIRRAALAAAFALIHITVFSQTQSKPSFAESERLEKLARKAVAAAVDIGFRKAFVTIVDTHITTIVSCAFLFIFGTGPVKGFAITLVIGLLANVFTAVFVSRVMFDWSLSRNPRTQTLSI